jgi:uncharacterized protein (DUF2236 family)
LSPRDRDQYCLESIPPSLALGMRDAEAPRTWHDLQAYLKQMETSGVIVVGPQARQLADAILRTSIPAILAPARAIPGLITAALLPSRIRQAYGLPWNEARQRRFERLASATRQLRRVTPAALALFTDARETKRNM